MFFALCRYPFCAFQKASCRRPQLHCTPFLRSPIYYRLESGFPTDSLVIFIANFLSHHLPSPPPTPQAKKLQRFACTCAGCTHQQDIKRGRDCYTPDFLPDWLDHHWFPTPQKPQKSSAASPARLPLRCTPAPPSPPRDESSAERYPPVPTSRTS